MHVQIALCALATVMISSACNFPLDDEAIARLYGKPQDVAAVIAKREAVHTFPDGDVGKGKGKDKNKDKDKDIPKQDGLFHEESAAGRVVGEQCKDSSQSICLGLKYVVYQDPSGDPIETDRDAADNVREANSFWRECGIQFQIERYLPIVPERQNLRYQTANYGELDEIRRKFMDRETLLVVTTGPWNRAGSLGNTWANAWTNLPGEGVYGSILERAVSKSPNVLAHELGHYLSLDHVADAHSLMNPVIYNQSTELTRGECKSARWAAGYFWKKMIRQNGVTQVSRE